MASIRQHDTIWNPNDTARLLEQDDPRISAHVTDLSERADAVANSSSAGELVRAMASRRLDEWEREKSLRPYLAYQARLRDEVSLLKGPESGGWTIWTCPNSLRDTESQINLQIETVDPTYESVSQPEIILGQLEPADHQVRGPVAEDDEVAESIAAAEQFDESAKPSP